MSWPFAMASLILVPMAIATPRQRAAHVVAAVIDALLTLFTIAAMSQLRIERRRPSSPPRAYARLVGRNLAGWLIALFIVKFATLEYFASTDRGGWIA
jgi:L-asparagine transporter-like permease